jgi:alpha-galactosidase
MAINKRFRLMSRAAVLFGVAWVCGCSSGAASGTNPIHYGAIPIKKVANKPPMGWNSWDVFGADVTEAEVKAAADVMARQLKPLGYEYVVIDIAWYAPNASAIGERYKEPRPKQKIDEFGRLIPVTERFPSAVDGAGFRPLADHLHERGLKLGLHVMRGIPRQAVENNTPIKGTPYRAQDIVSYEKACTFYDGMLSIDMSRPGAQSYYDSIVELYAQWGVDFIKADDMTSYPHKFDEVKAMRLAVENAKRPIVLSLSPGAVSSWDRNVLSHYADQFRISGDFWDEWSDLKAQFAKVHMFREVTGPGAWADCDMIPLGLINVRGEHGSGPRVSRFTIDEARSLIALWTIFRSPLMLGMSLTQLDPQTLALIANPLAIRVNQYSVGNREIRYVVNEESVWTARSPDGKEVYVALFNLTDEPRPLRVDLAALTVNKGFNGVVTNVFTHEKTRLGDEGLVAEVPPHGVHYVALSL